MTRTHSVQNPPDSRHPHNKTRTAIMSSRIAWVLIGVATALFVMWRLRPGESNEPPAPSQAQATFSGTWRQSGTSEVTQVEKTRRNELLLELDELLADAHINPGHVQLDADARSVAAELRASALAKLHAIDDEFTQAQTSIARERILLGAAEPHAAGGSVPPRGSHAAVVVAQIEEVPGTWIVRITDAELPQAAAWRQEALLVREGLHASLRSLAGSVAADDVSR